MKKSSLRFISLAAVALLAGASFLAYAGEEKDDESESVKEASIPAAVLATAKGALPGATFKEAQLEDEDGTKVYEIVMTTADGHEVEVMVTTDGQLTETEEKVKESALPAAVAKTLKEVLSSGKTEVIEKKTVVVYEVKREIGEKTYEVLIDANGEVLWLKAEHEEHGEHEGHEDKD